MSKKRDAYIEAHSLEFDLEHSDCKECYSKHLECLYYCGKCRNEVWNINNWGVVWMTDLTIKELPGILTELIHQGHGYKEFQIFYDGDVEWLIIVQYVEHR